MTPPGRQDKIRPQDVEAGLRAAAGEGLRPHVRLAHRARIRSRAVELGPVEATGRGRALTRVQRLDRWARAAAAVAALACVGLVGTGGAAWAARDALPGAPLYGLKIATERAAGALQVAPAGAVDHLLTRAERRLEEAGQLLDDGTNGQLVARTIAAHESLLEQAAARSAGDAELETRVQDAAVVAVARLEALLARDLPGVAAQQARGALEAVIDRLGQRPGGPPAGLPGDGPRRREPGGPPAAPPGDRAPAGPPDAPPAGPPAERPPAEPHDEAGGPARPPSPRDRDDRPGAPPRGNPPAPAPVDDDAEQDAAPGRRAGPPEGRGRPANP